MEEPSSHANLKVYFVYARRLQSGFQNRGDVALTVLSVNGEDSPSRFIANAIVNRALVGAKAYAAQVGGGSDARALIVRKIARVRE